MRCRRRPAAGQLGRRAVTAAVTRSRSRSEPDVSTARPLDPGARHSASGSEFSVVAQPGQLALGRGQVPGQRLVGERRPPAASPGSARRRGRSSLSVISLTSLLGGRDHLGDRCRRPAHLGSPPRPRSGPHAPESARSRPASGAGAGGQLDGRPGEQAGDRGQLRRAEVPALASTRRPGRPRPSRPVKISHRVARLAAAASQRRLVSPLSVAPSSSRLPKLPSSSSRLAWMASRSATAASHDGRAPLLGQ